MAYNIYKADGSSVIVPDNIISNQFFAPDTSSSVSGKGIGIRLLGRNVVDYGAAMAQDLLQMASNFASPTMPADGTSLQGQLWFNISDTTLYVKKNNATSGGIINWQKVGSTPTAQIGEPLYAYGGALLGYSTPAIPTSESVTDYVPMSAFSSGTFAGWLKATPGNGMTAEMKTPTGAVIGYAFPA